MLNNKYASGGSLDSMVHGSGKIRVLVVDDSVIVRRLVTRIIEEDSALEVVGSARNGVVALEKIEQLKPDVITMDVEMPEMDGIETLRELRRKHPHVRVIMFSTLTDHGASATIEALLLGANDYVAKPSNDGHLDKTLLSLKNELVPKIKQLFANGSKQQAAQRRPKPTAIFPARASRRLPPQAVVIGVSTGGPTALAEIMPVFPADFPLPIFIVQHMPALFTRLLAERLDSRSSIRVCEASEGMQAAPGLAIVAAGDYHMRIARVKGQVRVALNQESPENFCRPSVDVLFRSACEVYGGGVVTVILTGMGQDGLLGSGMLKREGSYVIAQDSSSSVVWGMPGSVVDAGIADTVLDLRDIVPEIIKQVRRI